MQVPGSTNLPLMFPPETKVFTTYVRIVRDFSHALILGTTFLYCSHRAISLASDEGFQSDPVLSWVRFLEWHCSPRVNIRLPAVSVF